MRTPVQPIQLSLDVAPHPALRWREDGGYLSASAKMSLDVVIPGNLEDGDYVNVTVTDPATGVVLGHTLAEVAGITFKPIKDQERRIGTERVHKLEPRGFRVAYTADGPEAVQPDGRPFEPVEDPADPRR